MSEFKKNSKVIVLERTKFALMVKNYRKSLYIIRILTHICEDKKIDLTMTSAEVAEVLDMSVEEIKRNRENGNLRFVERDGICFYEIYDIVRLKNASEMTAIYRFINEAAVLPQQLQQKATIYQMTQQP